ncbi:UNVERIFIED_CONTAM: WD-40 repeat-containing protein MSI4 [Sesamum latifolium]|uniref:WD-40 repeat-containing protein MSI4 n=1 Tax=Sesamum latifolium TaxID=2727402 RepID=A0AAW2UCV6_9LAMI
MTDRNLISWHYAVFHFFKLYLCTSGIYDAYQTDGIIPNTLVIATAEVVKSRVAAAEHISQVNRIRELPQNNFIVATHTDSPDILTGHQDNAEFALSMCSVEPFVLSGVPRSSVVLVMTLALYCGMQELVEKAHSADIHCVDWNPNDLNLILTGSADNTVHMYDRRKLTSGGVQSPIHIFEGHAAAVLCVQIGNMEGGSGTGNSGSTGLFFQHAGHRDKVVDFHWNALDPWTIVSVSDDAANNGGGGTLQIWRIIDFLYRAEDDVVNEMDNYKSHLLPCSSSKRK